MSIARPTLTALVWLLAGATLAQDEQLADYEIELVVFRHTRPLVASEQWPPQMLAPNLAGALDFGAPVVVLPERVQRVEPSRLLDEVRKLGTLGSYEILQHVAWRQPGYGEGESLPVRIAAAPLARPLSASAPARWGLGGHAPPAPATRDDNPVWPGYPFGGRTPAGSIEAIAGEAPAAGTVLTHTLDGTFTLVRSRFLHAYFDLIYTVPSSEVPQAIEQQRLQNPVFAVDTSFVAAPPAPLPLQSFRVRYHRRMRSQELHYIDHPMLGMLLLATPIEQDAGQLLE